MSPRLSPIFKKLVKVLKYKWFVYIRESQRDHKKPLKERLFVIPLGREVFPDHVFNNK